MSGCAAAAAQRGRTWIFQTSFSLLVMWIAPTVSRAQRGGLLATALLESGFVMFLLASSPLLRSLAMSQVLFLNARLFGFLEIFLMTQEKGDCLADGVAFLIFHQDTSF
ncbi:unnamed protein product [Prorocentrum cordatum]|uniref:Uncharacterized protein n=1 Tax=Prorocentrum cordatum TaxID=2364126 RepID=A0ABN9W6J2_9DINO|nr:unnamed protein product [Polarella glacialis]